MSGVLSGRIALVTGASRGIGAAVAIRFARDGAHVVLAARTVGGLEEVDDAIRAGGGSATLVPVDLRDFIKIDELAAALFDRWGRLDILVGNAAEFGVFSPLAHIAPTTWAEVVDLNLTANWRLIRAMGEPGRDELAPRFCDACFTGDYPIPHIDADDGKVAVQLSLLAEAV